MTSLIRFKINTPDVSYESFDNEVVIIDFETGNYYSLDKVGTDIWGFIEGGETVTEIVEGITHRYKGSRGHIETAVNQLIAELQKERLIVPDEVKEPGNTEASNIQSETHPETEKLRFEAPTLQTYTDMQELLLLDPIHEVDVTGWPNIKQNFPNKKE
ncbi:PqqD family protein [Thermodesulfobacteriota bacterium]